MKTKYLIRIVCGVVLLCSCNKENEVPPYQKASDRTYVMPKPVALTTEERAWLQEARDEYNNAIKGQ